VLEHISTSAQPLANGGISNVEVKVEAEVLFRRELGKKLMFLTLCRVGTGPVEGFQEGSGKNPRAGGPDASEQHTDKDSDAIKQTVSNASFDTDKEMTLEIALEQSSYHDPSVFRFDTDLLRIGAVAEFVGRIGKAIKVPPRHPNQKKKKHRLHA
jgi:hypothetical protein